jgi:hypothetical protein
MRRRERPLTQEDLLDAQLAIVDFEADRLAPMQEK